MDEGQGVSGALSGVCLRTGASRAYLPAGRVGVVGLSVLGRALGSVRTQGLTGRGGVAGF